MTQEPQSVILEGWDAEVDGREVFKREGTCVYLWLIHVDVQKTIKIL
jgi:hypothetical protein